MTPHVPKIGYNGFNVALTTRLGPAPTYSVHCGDERNVPVWHRAVGVVYAQSVHRVGRQARADGIPESDVGDARAARSESGVVYSLSFVEILIFRNV